ncbi:basic amino acid ABC transporter substrate-binding protein [Halarsenatibacter silvermanii]|uniref:Amino acid ABC transporter substrate-binding protein, PAAT family n=1 Tax=Halarsenatibacter silvermanii TaxID=321763 RepID=A0A1G9KZP1_9FIRM|nr:basic amino acid ABC transporter substrate-binding protein [Halarsenatibacter silvermanii]SDL55201.1 amino acid ABC transporter substrate-binding protein, PAAT family [Halarsenatibacter silvermanii]
MKKGALSILLVFALVLLFSTGLAAETYTVGTSAGFPPFEYVEDGEIVGFDIDLMEAIGEEQGFEVEFVDISFDSLIPGLNAGQFDIVAAGMTITEERAEVVDFTDPYFSANQAVLVREDSEDDLTVLYGDNKLAVQTGTTGDLWVEENLQDPEIFTGDVTHFDTFVMAVQDLVNENVDGVVLDTPVAQRYAEENPVEMVAEIITGEEYGLAVADGNTELLEKLNEGLEQVRESGRMDELLDKHF